MSGVRVGTRLEHLYQLRDQVAHEIAVEQRRVALGGPVPRTPVLPRKPSENRVDVRLRELGVTAGEVKRWAFDAGLILEIKRGRIAEALVEEFAARRELLNSTLRAEA